MIIDAHAHVYERLCGYGARGEFRPLGDGRGVWATGEVEQFLPQKYGDKEFMAETLLALMDENGVDRAVLLQGGNYGFHNDYAAEVAKKYPNRFTAVGTLDPYASCAQQILEHFIRDFGFRALKFELSQPWGLTGYHPDLKLSEKIFEPILSRANELGMTVVIDMGPVGTAGFQPETLFMLLKKYPDIVFVMTHCFFPGNDGKNEYRLDLMKKLHSERFLFDIANLPPLVWPEPYPYPSQRRFLSRARSILGAERMIWGTDIPGTLRNYTYRQMMDYVLVEGVFTDSELELVMAQNAIRAYHIR